MMKKAILALLLLFSGCVAATRPMGASKETGGDGEKSAPADSFISAPPSVEPPPGSAPTEPPAPISPMMRSLPGGPPTGDLPLADQPIAFAAPGPIDPKTDQAGAQPLYCTSHRFRYGADFSFPVYCLFPTPMKPNDNGDGTTSLQLLLEKNTSESQSTAGPWVAVPNEVQVRLVRSPAVNSSWESQQFIDAVSLSSSEGSNVLFPSLPIAPGFWNLFVFVGTGLSPDFQSVGLKPLPDEAMYDGNFVLAGRIEFIGETDPTKTRTRLFRAIPPSILESPPPRFLKDIYPFEP